MPASCHVAKDTKTLIQVRVEKPTASKLDKLAKAVRRSRANYVERLLEAHAQAVTPEIAKAVDPEYRR